MLQHPFISATNDTHGFLLGVSWILICGFSKKPSVQKLKREKANMQISLSSPRATLGTNGGLQLPEAQLVGRMLLQRLATDATGMKQVRYRRRPTREARHSYAHAQCIHIYTLCM